MASVSSANTGLGGGGGGSNRPGRPDYGLAGIGEWGYDFDQAIKQNNVRIGKSFMDFSDLLSYFDVSRLPDYDGMAMPYIGHVIFTRPSLNVSVYGGTGPSMDDKASSPATCTGTGRTGLKRICAGRREIGRAHV